MARDCFYMMLQDHAWVAIGTVAALFTTFRFYCLSNSQKGVALEKMQAVAGKVRSIWMEIVMLFSRSRDKPQFGVVVHKFHFPTRLSRYSFLSDGTWLYAVFFTILSINSLEAIFQPRIGVFNLLPNQPIYNGIPFCSMCRFCSSQARAHVCVCFHIN